ncbi:hypothetical protein [Natrialba asiatica]|uniref:Uncharacterized protein n=1 Tax=Natrialba asiatica (strain ATCC 700177 / DSM 12278 / JCM 9576 / FERM P-10747 / NBRC 102637 / 172P1) TaxID=29540 RepID=M0AL70_NATA1|nr:hypothetical protein [Natrialba asiatica]ELY99465.1 hypothetical protein C481_14568 [Natrialba asiatica DSM 12278]
MTERIEFGSKAAADQFRDEYADHLCADDDRRLKTVAISSDAPNYVLETATIEASDSQADRDGSGQLPLEDHEIESIDWSKGRANVPWARSVKAVMRDEGVDDWLAFLDPSLTVDEHRDVAKRATRDERGDRLDSESDVDEQLAETRAAGDQCGNAATHCEDGDDAACEFLTDECGFDESEVQTLLSNFDDEVPSDEITGKWLGTIRRAWQGYHNATDTLEAALAEAGDSVNHAIAAAKAINGIRRAHGQDEIEAFTELERLQRPLRWDPTAEISDELDTDDESDDQPLADDRHLEDETDETLFDHAVNEPDEGSDGPSREFRATQQDGYLRQSDGDDVDEREGLGQFGARRSDTKALEDFESDS